MGEPQRRFKHSQQGATGSPSLGWRASLQLNLGEFHIPVAIFVPDEFVDGARCIVEAVLVERLGNVCLGALQQAHDPPIGQRKIDIVACAWGAVFHAVIHTPFIRVVTVDIHQYIACGIPQLVTEIPIAFAAAEVEIERQ